VREISRSARLLVCVVFALLNAACATSSGLEQARGQLRAGDPEAALATLETLEVPRRDQLLLHLDRAMAAHAAGRYRDSIAAFDAADELIDKFDIVSIREQGATLVVSDRAASYRGESAERLWIRTFQMLNYLALDDAQGAGVEARRALAVLEEHEEILSRDPVSRLLVAMSFEAAGQAESAGVEYRKLVADSDSPGVLRAAWFNARRTARPDAAAELAGRVPERLAGEMQRELEQQHGELVVVLADGFVPRKQAGDIFVSTDLRVSFPFYADSYNFGSSAVNVLVDGRPVKATLTTTRLVDAARASLEARAARLTARHVARSAVKYNIAHSVSREDALAGELVKLLLFALEQADTRSWASLPATLTLVQIPLPSGQHDIELDLSGGAAIGRVRTRLDATPIRAGRRTFRSVRPGTDPSLHYAAPEP